MVNGHDHRDRTVRNLHSEQRSLPPQRQDTNLKVGSNAGSFIVSSRRVGPVGPSRRSDGQTCFHVEAGVKSVQCALGSDYRASHFAVWDYPKAAIG